jgi:hypothetical protein
MIFVSCMRPSCTAGRTKSGPKAPQESAPKAAAARSPGICCEVPPDSPRPGRLRDLKTAHDEKPPRETAGRARSLLVGALPRAPTCAPTRDTPTDFRVVPVGGTSVHAPTRRAPYAWVPGGPPLQQLHRLALVLPALLPLSRLLVRTGGRPLISIRRGRDKPLTCIFGWGPTRELVQFI